MDEYEQYEADCKKRRTENKTFLDGFEGYLQGKKLSKKTVVRHVDNIVFYINEFLLHYEAEEAATGVHQVGYYLGDWFTRKAMWASVTSIKSYITSLKHFYTFMQTIGQVTHGDLAEMKAVIKEEKEEWLEALRKYDDPDVDFEDIWT